MKNGRGGVVGTIFLMCTQERMSKKKDSGVAQWEERSRGWGGMSVAEGVARRSLIILMYLCGVLYKRRRRRGEKRV